MNDPTRPRPLHFVQIILNARNLMQWAARRGLAEDVNYAAHAILRDLYGPHAPQPYRVFDKKHQIHLVGYTYSTDSERNEFASLYAMPELMKIVMDMSSKVVPEQLPENLRFTALVSAMVRKSIGSERKEADVFLLASEEEKEKGRETIYENHFRKQMPEDIQVDGLEISRIQTVRRTVLVKKDDGDGRRPLTRFLVPEYEIHGFLKVKNNASSLVHNLLAKGIGRQKILGLGAILISR